ncbi:hypothetical protein HMPREF1531_02344 [Propionibacterium sp. oral taxon 192 str. F0372]|uniref:YraN family protein n=1 Tax=Propionibacterium sp. oral taxon 192 TaxID=671222 RepID=UPI000352C581|nr:YraN family protein [Propionibacterium sp. oral taxon 192]EPH00236.1 hypothetical protein HMPREF1531_02344 [Propionibacterium sp. oral taxon 192 str. F0372]
MGKSFGTWGEDLAAEYLERLGWQIVERNWRCSAGEIDLVALEPVHGSPPIGVIIEVKTRHGVGYGDPLEAITSAKIARLRRLACRWRSECGLELSDLRVDAIGILKRPGLAANMTHLAGVA